MTLPTSNILPLHSGKIRAGGAGLERYFRDLVFTLQDQYQQIAFAVNGEIRNNAEQGNQQYIPTISGTTTAGEGTYTRQIGWVLRQGLLTDVWFDISWSAHTGTGSLSVDMPYLSALGSGNPFIGTMNTQTITFSGYVVGVMLTDSRTMTLIDSISGATDANIAMLGAASLRGHIRYVGQAIERS